MSYVALATDKFDQVVRFYGATLGFDVVDQWDRPRGRGTRFDLGGGLRLEILDNAREPNPLTLNDRSDSVHIVVEVGDVQATWSGLSITAPVPASTSWGAQLFSLRDPDGVAVSFLQWDSTDRSQT